MMIEEIDSDGSGTVDFDGTFSTFFFFFHREEIHREHRGLVREAHAFCDSM